MTEWVERYYCSECGVVFREPFPKYADKTPCPYCLRLADAAWVPEGTTGYVRFAVMMDYLTERDREIELQKDE